MKTVKLDELVWQPHAFLKGCYTYVVMGDPTKAVTTVRIDKLPPHLKIPAHTHPYSEVITVLRGSYWNAMGDDAEAAAAAQGVKLKPGSSFVLPAGHVHHTWTGDEETILQVTFVGPLGVTFINPADDPHTTTATSKSIFIVFWRFGISVAKMILCRISQSRQQHPCRRWRII